MNKYTKDNKRMCQPCSCLCSAENYDYLLRNCKTGCWEKLSVQWTMSNDSAETKWKLFRLIYSANQFQIFHNSVLGDHIFVNLTAYMLSAGRICMYEKLCSHRRKCLRHSLTLYILNFTEQNIYDKMWQKTSYQKKGISTLMHILITSQLKVKWTYDLNNIYVCCSQQWKS
jgi:hypothetical protein